MSSNEGGPDNAEGAQASAQVGKRLVDLDKLGLKLVEADGVHRNYIIGTWALSASDAMSKRGVQRQVCRCEEDALAKAAFDAGLVWVLVESDDESVIHGWAAGKRGLLHWGYIPPPLRGRGLFRTIVKRVCGRDVSYTRKPRGYKMPGYWTFNPYRMGEE